MTHLTLSFLGSFHASTAREPRLKFESDKARALLAYLAVEQARPHERSSLAALFWPEQPDRLALRNLTQTLSRVRRAIHDRRESSSFFLISYQSIQFDAAAHHQLDVADFARLLASGLPAQIERAVALYQGEFLAGFHLPDSPEFETWLLFKREHYQRLALESLATLTELALAEGNYAQASMFARRQIELDSLLEPAHRQLMVALARSGQRSAALAHYQKCREILAQELGATPENETEELYRQILDDEFGVEPSRVQRAGLHPMAHRQAPLEAPLSNLPHPLTSLLGRSAEMAWLQHAFGEEKRRLVTLVGPGGSGKTHMALHAAHALQPYFPQGVYFISLVAVGSIQQLIGALADGLRLTFQSSQLSQAQLLDYLRRRRLLLVLDNFEHLLHSVELIEAILRTTPQVALLVTSRERLNLHGEHLLLLGGLEVPALALDPAALIPADLEDYGAIQLFVQSAQRTLRDFALDHERSAPVVKIVRLLEGLPLAIELAAAWVRILPCRTIADEIEKSLDFLTAPYHNFPERHRSLRAVFAYSWRLASVVEQAALRRLWVFVGGFDHKAAGEIAGVTLPVLLALLDKSLLQSNGEGRYRWHPIVRQYAHEQLVADPTIQQEIWPRYRRYYLELLQQRSQHIMGALQKQTLEEIEQELENVQLVWQWVDLQLDLSGLDRAFYTLFHFYRIRGRLEELIEVCESALGLFDGKVVPGQIGPPLVVEQQAEHQETYWRLLAYLAGSLIHVARYDQAEEMLQQTLAYLRHADLPFLTGFSLKHLAMLFVHRGRFVEARRLYEQSLACFQQLQDQPAQADILNSLGVVCNDLGEFGQAIGYLEESIALNRMAGNRANLVYALSNRGASSYNIERYAEAQQFHAEALAIAREVDFRPGIMLCLLNLADVGCALRQYEQARTLAEEGLALTRKNHDPRQAVWARSDLGLAELGLGHVDRAREHFCRGIAAGLAIKVTPRALESLVGLAHWMTETEQVEQAIELLSFCLHHPNLQRKIRDRANRLLAVIEEKVEPAARQDAWARGSAKQLGAVAAEIIQAYNAERTPPLVMGVDAVW